MKPYILPATASRANETHSSVCLDTSGDHSRHSQDFVFHNKQCKFVKNIATVSFFVVKLMKANTVSA